MRVEPKSLLAMDCEVANRWWWYDSKSTHRLMIFVGKWIIEGVLEMPPFGWILLPDIIVDNRSMMKNYRGLPVTTRAYGLELISRTIVDADVLVGHNLSGFDLGTINGELMLQNMPLLPKREVIDTLNDGPKGVFQQRSLANRLSRLDGVVAKPHVDPVVWEAAFNDFEPGALREVWERACADVQGHIDLFRNDRERSYV